MQSLLLVQFMVACWLTCPTPTTTTTAFHIAVLPSTRQVLMPTTSTLYMAVATGNEKKVPPPKKKGYDPKWKKLETLVDKDGASGNLADIGLTGSIPVLFKQGNENRTTVALPGQPIREVAIQAGQFIKYGCGKGECGTCECLVNGQWVRPCVTNVPPALDAGQNELVIVVKAIKNKGRSSGKFYSFRSFLMGFYNNALGMIGFVKYRKHAKRNWAERQEYEDLIKQKTMEKKRMKEQQQMMSGGDNNNSNNNKKTTNGLSSGLKP
jgi:2Fe-2S iron-sulfur cluster binding domain